MAGYFIGITDKGNRREKNEDTFIAEELSNKEFLVACVIDGVGGYTGGDVAAAIARKIILEQLRNISGDIIQRLQQALIAANAAINNEKKKADKNAQMACVLTCVVTHLKTNKFYYAHVGDTRLYLLRDHSLVKISKDHSAVGFLEESGRLSEEDAMRHPRRNEINKALGFEEDITNDFIEAGESPFLPGDIILLCSDGLSDMIGSNAINSILLKNVPLTEKAKQLVDAANEAGGNDNITAVLVENNNPSKEQVALKPAEKKKEDKSFPKEAALIPKQDIASQNKNSNRLIAFLSVISLLLLVALMIALFKENRGPLKNAAVIKADTVKPRNENFEQLLSHVNDTTKIFSLAKGLSLQMSEALLISKDSFHLIGNGDTIYPVANYKGPGFNISDKAKKIVLDSIVFKDFGIALIIQKNNVEFKNVRFFNCNIPVQYAVGLPDSTISGRFKDSVFLINKPLNNH